MLCYFIDSMCLIYIYINVMHLANPAFMHDLIVRHTVCIHPRNGLGCAIILPLTDFFFSKMGFIQ